MTAIHGGKAKNEKLNAHRIAVLLRGGMVPQAAVYPAEMRATRDRLRRRLHLRRQRAELLAHIHHTNSPSNRPEIGQQRADNTNRVGVAERCPAPAVQKSIEVALALINHDDRLRTDLELDLVQTAKAPDAQTCYRLRSLPGGGQSLALVRRYDIHASRRCPRGQECVSYGRLVTCAQASAGNRDGTSGQKIGHATLKWAFSAAAVRCLRNNPAGQQDRARLEKQHGQGKAFTVLAHTWARAVYSMLTRDTAFALDKFLHE
jgi:Transposase IS116/IS110/IS902 family